MVKFQPGEAATWNHDSEKAKNKTFCLSAIFAVLALCVSSLIPQPANAATTEDERPAKLKQLVDGWDYVRRVVEIPMRDGVKLHTVILIPKGVSNTPMLLTRTPYNAEALTSVRATGNMGAALNAYDGPTDVVIKGKYIRVFQDIRGKYGSEGIYLTTPPLSGSKYNLTKTDESTDAHDTVEWLAHNVPESNNKVGILGISYDGYEVLMALINPHPALKVAVASNPLVDGWKGDDWFHNGAFRQTNIEYIWDQGATRDNSSKFWWSGTDLYSKFLRAGTAGKLGEEQGVEQIGFWKKILEHPTYDDYWQSLAVDNELKKHPLNVPVMVVHGLWDQEDTFGPIAAYKALEAKDKDNDKVYLTMGPWYHGQQIGDGSKTGDIHWDQDTGKWWRMKVLAPFLAHHLKGEPMDVAPVTVFRSGSNEWQKLSRWPVTKKSAKLFLRPDNKLSFDTATQAERTQTVDYISDPAHPIPFLPRPVYPVYDTASAWPKWLTTDQRHASSRPDVATFVSDVLTEPVTISGEPVVHLTASTSGTDSDWVVKLIDVYPDIVPVRQEMGGYEFPISLNIFRGRYRKSFTTPSALQANVPLAYKFALPVANHTFLPGHKIMVQVQSSLFPLYDRNPQTYVANIFFAKPSDFVKTEQKITVSGPQGSFIEFPTE